MLDLRPEGVYVSTEIYPYPGGVKLTKIERVNGNQTVDHVLLTPEEVQTMLQKLKEVS